MRYSGRTINLKDSPEAIEAYKRHHRAVWPQVEAALSRGGIRNMRIFLIGRRLFMYMETEDDFDAGRFQAQYLSEPRAVEWEQLMRTLQEPVPEAHRGEWWSDMEAVYELPSSPR